MNFPNGILFIIIPGKAAGEWIGLFHENLK